MRYKWGTFTAIYFLLGVDGHEVSCLSTSSQFGASGKQVQVKTIDSFPDSASFFTQYVFPQVPVLIKQGFTVNEVWKSDEAMVGDNEQIEAAKNFLVPVQLEKKEDSYVPVEEMSFYDFLQNYKDEEMYLTYAIPKYLQNAAVLPYPLQCAEIADFLYDSILWFSSGGTKSVVHSDDGENILCVLDGLKEWILVDPRKHNKHSILDIRSSSYSTLDVDNVDLVKYPDLATMEYIHANISTGDCLYIPNQWIHQVNSYQRNVAINVWWNPYHQGKINFDKCENVFDPTFTIDKVNFTGYHLEQRGEYIEHVQEMIENLLGDNTVTTYDEVFEFIIGTEYELDLQGMTPGQIALGKKYCEQIFKEIDTKGKGQVRSQDMESINMNGWKKIQKILFNIKHNVIDKVGYDESATRIELSKEEL